MASPAAVLSILVRANTGQATTGLLRLNQSLAVSEGKGHKTARAIEGVAKAATLIGGAAVIGGLTYAARKAADFEQQMSSLGAVTDANARQMERFRKQAMKAGADTKFSALEAAEAQTELAKGGLSVKQIMRGGLRSALALAAAGEMELADAAEATVNAMKLFGLRGKDAMRVADGFATAANSTTANVSDFALALKMGGSAAKAAGLTFTDTTTILEALAEIGIKGSDAGTSMKAALTQLAAPTEKSVNLMDDLGLKFFDAHGKMRDVADISGMLRDKLGQLTEEQRLQAVKTLAGTDGMRALLALYDAGPKKITRFHRELGKQGTAADVAKKKQDNLKGSLEQLGGSIETLGIQVGTALIPTIRRGADELTDLANKIGRIISRDDLTLGEKLQRSIDVAKVTADPWVAKLKDAIDRANIPDKIAALISAATPVIVKAAAAGGLAAAKTFAGAFAESDVWGKLVLGGWLLSRMGGRKGFFGMGAKAGVAFGEGMAATGGSGFGLVGRLKGALKGLKGLAGRFLAIDIGVNLIDSQGNPIAAVINTAHDLTFGIVPKVKMLTGMEKWRGSFDAVAKHLDKVTGTRDVSGIVAITKKIRAMAHEARDFGRADLGKQLDKLADKGDATVTRLGEQQRKVAGMSDRFAAAIRGLRVKGSKDFDGLVHHVTFGARQILKQGDEKSTQTRKAISRQFAIARDRIRDHFRGPDGVVHISKAGFQALHELAVKQLGLYGIKAGRVNVVLAKGANGQMRPNQRGGHINEGAPTGDSVPSLLERGEYVLNRNAVRKVGKRSLDRLNFGVASRFQAGGMVDPAWDPGGQRINSAISGKVGQWARRYQADMTAGYDPGGGHVSPGHNVTGTATDMVPLAGDWDLLEKGLRVLTAAGLKVLYGSNGVGTPWPNHGRGNHAHIEWGMGAGVPLFDGIARVMLQGPSSVALEAGQGALDRVRGAANSAIERALASVGEGVERGFGEVAATGNGAGLMRAISGARGWNFSDWWALDGSETGHGANLTNPTSTARLRGQFLRSNWGRYGPGSDPSANPSMGQQIQSMAQYISERYGNPTAAWDFHRQHNYYREGGAVGLQRGGNPFFGGPHGNRFTQLPTPQVTSLADQIGTTLHKVRHGKSSKVRQAAITRLLNRIKKSGNVGLPKKLQTNLTKFAADSNTFGEYADRAAALTTEDANGNPIPAPVKGKTEIQWLEAQLTALWQWRNAILRAEKIIRDRREKIGAAIDVARKRFHSVSAAIKAATKTRKSLDRQLHKAQKKPKANRALIKTLRGKIKDIDQAQRPRVRVQNALKERILPALTGKASSLGKLRDELMTDLTEVQGLGSSMRVMKKMPVKPGVFGGQLFDVQMQLRDLNAPRPSVTDDAGDVTDDRSSLLAELLRQANLRTAVSEAQFNVFKNMPQFATGGIVQGPAGQAVPAVVHAGEGVFTREQMAAMGAPSVVVIVQDGAVREDKIRVLAGDEAQRAMRQAGRAATRGMPGRGGGLSRG